MQFQFLPFGISINVNMGYIQQRIVAEDTAQK